MRIVISGQTYYPGNNGQGIFTIHLAEGLARAGNSVAVVVPSDTFSYHQEQINGVQVHRLHSIPLDWLHPEAFFNPLPGSKFRSILRDFRPDVLHVQDHYFLNMSGVRIARQMGIPVLATNHFLPENLLPYGSWVPLPTAFKTFVLWQIMIWTYRHAQMITTPTETAARILEKQHVGPPISAVSCGVDTNRFKPVDGFSRDAVLGRWGFDPAVPVFLYVGRLDREKRIDLLLRGMAQLRDRGEGTAQLVVAGAGSARGELHALVESLHLGRQVVFAGYVPAQDLPDLYRACDLFCMASPEELQSIATLEAMASGKPVIAANARALPELVTPEVNGMLFAPGRPESVADAMGWMLRHRDRWQAMGHASRARAVVHSIENTIRRYEEIYTGLKESAPRAYRGARRLKAPVSIK